VFEFSTVYVKSFKYASYLPQCPDAGETMGCKLPYTRKLPKVYPNLSDASPNRASTLYGPSSLGGVPLSPSCLWSARLPFLRQLMGRSYPL